MGKQVIIGTITVMVLSLGFAAGQALALNTTIGMNYGPYHLRGQAPPGSNISSPQFVSDLTQVAYKFGYIKTYGSDPVLARIVPLISQYKLLLSAVNSLTYLRTYAIVIACKKSMLAPFHHPHKNISAN